MSHAQRRRERAACRRRKHHIDRARLARSQAGVEAGATATEVRSADRDPGDAETPSSAIADRDGLGELLVPICWKPNVRLAGLIAAAGISSLRSRRSKL